MMAAIPRTASSVVPSARALAGTTSESSESDGTTRLRLRPPSVAATVRTASMHTATLTRLTEDRAHSFERQSPQEPTDTAVGRVPYVESIVTRASRTCEEARRARERPRGGTAPPRGGYYLPGGRRCGRRWAAARHSAGVSRRGRRGRLLATRPFAQPPVLIRVSTAGRSTREECQCEDCRQSLFHLWILLRVLTLDLHGRCDLLTAALLILGDDHRAGLQLGAGDHDGARDCQPGTV